MKNITKLSLEDAIIIAKVAFKEKMIYLHPESLTNIDEYIESQKWESEKEKGSKGNIILVSYFSDYGLMVKFILNPFIVYETTWSGIHSPVPFIPVIKKCEELGYTIKK